MSDKIQVGHLAAIVDEENMPMLRRFNWLLLKSKKTFYAVAHVKIDNNRVPILMHRLIMGFPVGITDHINGNGLDNRINNLRIATSSQNCINRKFPNKLGLRGVSRNASGYLARIKFQNKCYCLGTSADPKDAARAYDEAAKRLHGEFAVLNFKERE